MLSSDGVPGDDECYFWCGGSGIIVVGAAYAPGDSAVLAGVCVWDAEAGIFESLVDRGRGGRGARAVSGRGADEAALPAGMRAVPGAVPPQHGVHVRGELYAVDQAALALLDELEGVTKGHYERRPLVLTDLESSSQELLAEAYFAHLTLQRGLSSAPHIPAYTKKETVNYVYRKDRPKNRTFLEHVHHWIDAQGPLSYIRV